MGRDIVSARDPFWNKLCLHALVRSVVVGNVLMQPMFADKQAFFFENSTDPIRVQEYVYAANRQLIVFSLVGWVGRVLVLAFPTWDRKLSYGGLVLWVFGLFLLTAMSGSISFNTYQALSYAFISCGGGLYFWCSLDDVIYLTKILTGRHKVLIIFGCFSAAYIYVTHWIYRDFAYTTSGYLSVQPTLFLISVPLTSLLFAEEWAVRNEVVVATETTLREEWNTLITISFKNKTLSFQTHILFMLIYGIFRQMLTPTLFLDKLYTPSENESLLFWRSFGLILGEALFLIAFRWVYIPTFAAVILPILLADWRAHANTFSHIVVDVFFVGFCVGTLNVWVIHRIITQWLLVEGVPATKRRLNILLFIMASSLLAGDLLINAIVALIHTHQAYFQSSVILFPSFVVAVVIALVIMTHWVLFNVYEA